jgi:homospermidine synthase
MCTEFQGKMIFVGFGSIAVGTLPLVLKHINIDPSNVHLIAKDTQHAALVEELGVKYTQTALTVDNCQDVLVNQMGLSQGDFLVNLSVDVSSKALIGLCHNIGALYIDTCIEPWIGSYDDPSKTLSERSNYALRHEIRQEIPHFTNGPTAVVAHGANPGLVNHFVKRALAELSALKFRGSRLVPTTREGWGALASDIGVKVIQISERDTQRPKVPKQRNEFVNTWSVDGFISEGIHQPSELGWGTHEKTLPDDGFHHDFGNQCAIYLEKPGGMVKVRGWTPLEGPYHGFLVTHNESISIADYLTLRSEDGKVIYRPTSYYCYHPCDAAVLSVHEIFGREKVEQSVKRVLQPDDILDGVDELGVLLLGDFGLEFSGYWHGSRLSNEGSKAVKYNQATSLQVTATVLAGIIWAIENPRKGLVEPDDLNYERVLEVTDPYTAPNVSVKTNWNPGNKDFQIRSFLVE